MVRVQRGGQRLHTDAVDRECGGHGGGGAVDETFEKKIVYTTPMMWGLCQRAIESMRKIQ